jgi:hypothetical protein
MKAHNLCGLSRHLGLSGCLDFSTRNQALTHFALARRGKGIRAWLLA